MNPATLENLGCRIREICDDNEEQYQQIEDLMETVDQLKEEKHLLTVTLNLWQQQKFNFDGETAEFAKYFEDALENVILGESDKVDTDAVIAEAARLHVEDKAVLVISKLMLDCDILKQLDTYRDLLFHFCNTKPKAQRYLLGALEQLLTSKNTKSTLLSKTTEILHKLYVNDIVDVAAIVGWQRQLYSKYVDVASWQMVKMAAGSFIAWLSENRNHNWDELTIHEKSEVRKHARRFLLFKMDSEVQEGKLKWEPDWFRLYDKMSLEEFQAIYGPYRPSLVAELASHGLLQYRKYRTSEGWTVVVWSNSGDQNEAKFKHPVEREAEALFFDSYFGRKALFIDHLYRSEADTATYTSDELTSCFAKHAAWLAETNVVTERGERLLHLSDILYRDVLGRFADNDNPDN